MLNQLRTDAVFVPELDFAMEKNGKLIGQKQRNLVRAQYALKVTSTFMGKRITFASKFGIAYFKTGTYQKKKAELLPVIQQPEREILETAIVFKQQPTMVQDDFDRLSGQLFRWASRLIIEYRPDKIKASVERTNINE